MSNKNELEKMQEIIDKANQEIDYLLKKANRYGLNWNKTIGQQDVTDLFTQNFPILSYIPDKLIGEGKNVLIEGDNLDALIYLASFFPNTFDAVPTDPPYNTGNIFTYSDNFKTKNFNDRDADFSSKWLNMMAQRLLLVQKILKDDGIVLINIDEYEYANLELLCKMIFPIHVGTLIWKKNAPKNNSKTISTNHEFILVFGNHKVDRLEHLRKPNYDFINSKMNEMIKLKGKTMIPPEIEEALLIAFPEVKRKDLAKTFADRMELMTEERINKSFKSWLKSQSNFSAGDVNFDLIDFEKKDLYRGADLTAPSGKLFDILHPITKKPCKMPSKGRGWAFTEENIEKMIKNGDILFGDDETTQPKKKLYASSVTTAPLDSVLNEAGTGKADLTKLGMNGSFDYAKPVSLIKTLLKLKPKDSKVMDIFAGSGTVGQAVVELNKEDGGTRSFVLITNNENNICEEITYERLKRVMLGHKSSDYLPILDQGLSYFKTKMIKRNSNYEQFKHDLTNHIVDVVKFIDKTFNESENNENIILSNNEFVSIIQKSLDIDVLVNQIKTQNKKINLYLTDLDGDEIPKEIVDSLNKLEEDLFYRALNFDIKKLKV